MTLRPGDKVKFKDEPEQGVVVRMDKKGYVIVKTTDGFERPVEADDLMLTGTDDMATLFEGEKKEEPMEEEEMAAPVAEENREPVGREEPRIFLGILQRNEKFAFYLINDSDYFLWFTFGTLKGEHEARMLEKGLLEDNTKLLLAELLPAAATTLFIQCILFGTPFFIARPPVDRQFPFGINAIPRAREFKDNPYFDDKAWLIPLIRQSLSAVKITVDKHQKEKILKDKGDLSGRRMMLRPKIAGNEPIEEVDLHAESFLENTSGMSKGEILEAQLSRFEIALEGAMRNKQKKMVFIHGLGNGKLKHEIRKRLDRRKIRYQDASFKEYGYGATLVLLK